jgi:hypothetical protein
MLIRTFSLVVRSWSRLQMDLACCCIDLGIRTGAVSYLISNWFNQARSAGRTALRSFRTIFHDGHIVSTEVGWLTDMVPK